MTKLATGLQIVLGLFFLMSAFSKLTGGADDMRAELEVAAWLWTAIAIVEIAGALTLLASLKFSRLALPAATGFSIFMIGAIGAHVRAGDLSGNAIAPVVLLVLFLTVVAVRWNLFVIPDTEPHRSHR